MSTHHIINIKTKNVSLMPNKTNHTSLPFPSNLAITKQLIIMVSLPLSPFMSVTENHPLKPARPLRVLILSDLRAIPQRIAQLSQWLASNSFSFTIDLILAVGISRPCPDHTCTQTKAQAELGNDSATLAELEQICPRVVYVPGLHETSTSWETNNTRPPSLTSTSLNAIVGPVHVTDDLLVTHRRFMDGLTYKPIHQLPRSWRQTLYSKLMRPVRFKQAQHKCVIVLCSSQQLKENKTTEHCSASKTPEYDVILTISPANMQRTTTSSAVFKLADRICDPGTFGGNGDFCIANMSRPPIWEVRAGCTVDETAFAGEKAWKVESIEKYNLEKPAHNHTTTQ